MSRALEELKRDFEGELFTDSTVRKLYSTDASIYQELPLAVAIPKSKADLKLLIQFADKEGIGLIPRAAGTSLAGQVVGSGIVVDISKHFKEIIQTNSEEKWVRVQPGVIRDELNHHLKQHGLFFGPETSTSNRATIGGMFGNNSCGSNSIFYGTTRENVISVSGLMSDGSEVTFAELSKSDFAEWLARDKSDLQTQAMQQIATLLSSETNREQIRANFPESNVTRRNMGYAIDELLKAEVFGGNELFNFCKVLAGSEGTLFLATELKLRCHNLPAPNSSLLCAHFRSIKNALRATQIAIRHPIVRCELIDRLVIEGASRNTALRDAAAFFKDDPAAVLLIEVRDSRADQARNLTESIVSELSDNGLGYHFPILENEQTDPIWQLRKAGLGVVGNVVGDAKPVTVIEDTAVSVDVLPDYIEEIDRLLRDKYQSPCVFYGHAGAGEIHLRPILNLKNDVDRQKLRQIAEDVAVIVKKYNGSLSGEHGDGRLRSEFLEQMIGSENYQMMVAIKQLWDPNNIFNPGKIVDAWPLTKNLRQSFAADSTLETTLNFDSVGGFRRAAEMCTGSGDCLKTELSGGTMCPSYMATGEEKDSTRARANILRHAINDGFGKIAKVQVKEVMDLCLSCKACKSECPSNVDVAKLKAEFLQSYYDSHGTPLRVRAMSYWYAANNAASVLPRLANFFARDLSFITNRVLGIHQNRKLPRFRKSMINWFEERNRFRREKGKSARKVFLFCDEFTEFHDSEVGIAAIELLERLGYEVMIPDHTESGRVPISLGLLRKARSIAEENVKQLGSVVSQNVPLVGIEPSAILTLRDEYPDLVRPEFREASTKLASCTFSIEEFLVRELDAGRFGRGEFTGEPKTIFLHGHCHQKALGTLGDTVRALQIPKNFRVKLIPSGCCGMAGAFGYKRENYEISMQVGELVLFPRIRAISDNKDAVISAPGTSCRQQIMHGTQQRTLHPVEILRDAISDQRQ